MLTFCDKFVIAPHFDTKPCQFIHIAKFCNLLKVYDQMFNFKDLMAKVTFGDFPNVHIGG